MGVKYSREYAQIISEFANALGHINTIYTFLEMDGPGWESLDPAERTGCIRTIADDLFYALGTEKEFAVGATQVFLDEIHHRICVRYADGSRLDIDLIDRG